MRSGNEGRIEAGLVWLLALGLACSGPAIAGSSLRDDAEVKAALLYHFTRFVEWPPEAFSSAGAPMIIGILGRDPFGRALDKLVEHESVGGHPIQIVRFRAAEEARSSHLLFISASERGACGAVLRELHGRPVLTVAEFDTFPDRGGIVQLHRGPGGKIRLRVNLAAARAASLTLSAKLLRVAEAVQP